MTLEPLKRIGSYHPRWTDVRSNSLLLIKPPKAPHEPMIDDTRPASLLDINDTLSGLLRLPATQSDGQDLYSVTYDDERIRFYHFYDQKGGSGWTDEMTRFRIEVDHVSKEETVPLKNNPK